MKITIYQIETEKDRNREKFLSLSDIELMKGKPEIDSSIYEKTYEKAMNYKDLEEVFRVFNLSRPEDFAGHSLSVSDVIEVDESDTISNGFYYCDSNGFSKIDFDKELCEDSWLLNETIEDEIEVIIVEPHKPRRAELIDNDYVKFREIVDGYVEHFYPFADEVCIVCNEEGKLRGLPLNRAVYAEDDFSHYKKGEMIEVMAGTFFIAYAPQDSEQFRSLPADLKEKYLEKFKTPERFYMANKEIIAVPYDKKRSDFER